MRYRQLGESGLTVSVIGLGGNNFGGRIGLEETRGVVDAAIDCGVTLVDTADIYGNRGGSEELLGQVLAGRREHVVLATKFGMDMGEGTVARGSRGAESLQPAATGRGTGSHTVVCESWCWHVALFPPGEWAAHRQIPSRTGSASRNAPGRA
jgi:aryl-alcohol dehydrogenase-like predicted oxidoreductase